MKKLIILVSLLGISFLSFGFYYWNAEGIQQNGDWKAPASANKMKNPLSGNEQATTKGKKLFKQMCAICHGAKGKGDGIAGMSLNPRPTNFSKEKTQSQTDGSLFWKMSEGRTPMIAYKGILKEEQRWELVNYIRTLKK